MTKKMFLFSLSVLILLSSCAVIKQDEIGVKRKWGKISDQVLSPGVTSVNPFSTKVIRLPARTVNLEVQASLPSKEGLTILTDISILYHLIPEKANVILQNAGLGYENTIILPVFRSAIADVSARFFAKDMHSSKRSQIEQEVLERMQNLLEERGFEIESVLMKSVRLPVKLSQAIENKLEAEQEAQRMEFVLNRERQEANRLKIEAEGIRDYQKIISENLNSMVLQFMSIEAFRELAKSNNSKVIITDGKTPMMIDQRVE
ncbi:MAG: prohibitin family protein [Bacteroidota bacterium]